MQPISLDGASLSLASVVAVARDGVLVQLDADARARMESSCAWVQRAASGGLRDAEGRSLAVYGVNTGYGSLARVRIGDADISRLSWNLLRSHAAGVGPIVDPVTTRAMMLLRANALAKGASGCRPALVDSLAAMLNRGVVPEVPSQGSCGSSGDLAPLCHLGLVVFRDDADLAHESGSAWIDGERHSGRDAMKLAGIERLIPGPKEGLAMSNGAQLSTAFAALACWDAAQLVLDAEIAAALSFEALCGVRRALHPAVHALRPYRGAIACASNLRRLLDGSTLVDSLPDKVQDAYSLRCTPQVLGAVRDGVRFASDQVLVELNSATDNPLILLDAEGDNKAYSAGLFHGEPVGMAADHLKLALCELAALSERRIYRLTTGTLSARLPPHLVRGDRPNMGMMVPQTSAAALVSENRSLAWPASADSIPTCEDQEDHVAMSTTAARRATDVLGNSRLVVAIELLSAVHGVWARQDEDPNAVLGAGSAAAVAVLEDVLGGRRPSVIPAEDIERIDLALREGRIVRAVQQAIGPLEGV